MANELNSPLASEAEIQAALAEAEAEGEIPSLDDGQPIVAVPVPVQVDVGPPPAKRSSDGKGRHVVATVAVVDGQEGAAAAGKGLVWRWSLLWRVPYRALDIGLDVVNYPFRRLGPGARIAVAALAITTLIMSALAVFVLPVVAPHRTAISDLRQKCQKALEPPPAAASEK